MTEIRYHIVPRLGGWSIRCGEVEGLPYSHQSQAVSDAQFAAKALEKIGETVGVYVGAVRVGGRPIARNN